VSEIGMEPNMLLLRGFFRTSRMCTGVSPENGGGGRDKLIVWRLLSTTRVETITWPVSLRHMDDETECSVGSAVYPDETLLEWSVYPGENTLWPSSSFAPREHRLALGSCRTVAIVLSFVAPPTLSLRIPGLILNE
jgi:hypothetical protein